MDEQADSEPVQKARSASRYSYILRTSFKEETFHGSITVECSTLIVSYRSMRLAGGDSAAVLAHHVVGYGAKGKVVVSVGSSNVAYCI